jgi:hypothetical protein
LNDRKLESSRNQAEIDLLIERISNSGIEFRRSIDEAIFKRLKRFFNKRNRQITRETRLEAIFTKQSLVKEWEELKEIGLIIPELERNRAYGYLTAIYFIVTFLALITVAFKNLDLVFVLWGLPVLGIIITLVGGPLILFMILFRKKYLPCTTVDELVDQIVSANWSNLMNDGKKLFKQIITEEEKMLRTSE